MSRNKILAVFLLTIGVLSAGFVVHAQPSEEAADQGTAPQAQQGPVADRPAMQARQMQMLGFGPLLRIEAVRKELKVDDEQTEQLRQLSVQLREEQGPALLELSGSLRDLAPEERVERAKEIRKQAKEIRKQVDARLAQILRPEQLKRLKQIGLQIQWRRHAMGVLHSKEIAQALDLTDEQKEELKETAKQARIEAQEKIRQVLDQAREKVKDVLTLEQQEKLQLLLGPEFDLPEALLPDSPSNPSGRRGLLRNQR